MVTFSIIAFYILIAIMFLRSSFDPFSKFLSLIFLIPALEVFYLCPVIFLLCLSTHCFGGIIASLVSGILGIGLTAAAIFLENIIMHAIMRFFCSGKEMDDICTAINFFVAFFAVLCAISSPGKP